MILSTSFPFLFLPVCQKQALASKTVNNKFNIKNVDKFSESLVFVLFYIQRTTPGIVSLYTERCQLCSESPHGYPRGLAMHAVRGLIGDGC